MENVVENNNLSRAEVAEEKCRQLEAKVSGLYHELDIVMADIMEKEKEVAEKENLIHELEERLRRKTPLAKLFGQKQQR